MYVRFIEGKSIMQMTNMVVSLAGFVQLVPKSDAVAHILSTHRSIQQYFRVYGPSESSPYGINPEIMDTYIKSCG